VQITVLMVITDFLEPFLSLSIKVFNSVKRREKQTSVHTEQIELKFLSEKKKVFLHSIRSSYEDLKTYCLPLRLPVRSGEHYSHEKLTTVCAVVF